MTIHEKLDVLIENSGGKNIGVDLTTPYEIYNSRFALGNLKLDLSPYKLIRVEFLNHDTTNKYKCAWFLPVIIGYYESITMKVDYEYTKTITITVDGISWLGANRSDLMFITNIKGYK